jgi:hypothetical protein
MRVSVPTQRQYSKPLNFGWGGFWKMIKLKKSYKFNKREIKLGTKRCFKNTYSWF